MLLSTQATKFAAGKVLDHTPAGAITAGAPTAALGLIMGIPANDIAAGALGSLDTEGHFVARKVQLAFQAGDILGWDSNGSPYGGTASSGCVTNVRTDMDYLLGTCLEAAASTAHTCKLALNEFPPDVPLWRNKTHEIKTSAYSLDAQDAGKVIHCGTDAVVFTLPSTVAGLELIVINDAADAGALITLNPATLDAIMGPDLAGTPNKDSLNTKTTHKRYDYTRLVGDGVDGWWIADRRGTWAAEG